MQIPENAGKVSLNKLAHIAVEELTEETQFATESARLYHEEVDGFRMDYLWSPNPAQKQRLFVFFSGDAKRDKNDPPVFQRWSWSSHFPGSCLFVSDPSLYLAPDIGLAWYSGTKDFDPLVVVAERVARLAKQLGIATRDIFAYGSSGGGFAALRFAALVEGIAVITINPQILITQFRPLHHVKRFAKVCFDLDDPIKAAKLYPDRFSILEHVEALKQRRIIYVQNISDPHHVEEHFRPFCAAMGASTEANLTNGKFRRIMFDHPDGHSKAETPEAFSAILDIATMDFSPA